MCIKFSVRVFGVKRKLKPLAVLRCHSKSISSVKFASIWISEKSPKNIPECDSTINNTPSKLKSNPMNTKDIVKSSLTSTETIELSDFVVENIVKSDETTFEYSYLGNSGWLVSADGDGRIALWDIYPPKKNKKRYKRKKYREKKKAKKLL